MYFSAVKRIPADQRGLSQMSRDRQGDNQLEQETLKGNDSRRDRHVIDTETGEGREVCQEWSKVYRVKGLRRDTICLSARTEKDRISRYNRLKENNGTIDASHLKSEGMWSGVGLETERRGFALDLRAVAKRKKDHLYCSLFLGLNENHHFMFHWKHHIEGNASQQSHLNLNQGLNICGTKKTSSVCSRRTESLEIHWTEVRGQWQTPLGHRDT